MKTHIKTNLVMIPIIAFAAVLFLMQSIEYQYSKKIDLTDQRILTVERGDSTRAISKKLFFNNKQSFLFSKIASIKGRDIKIKAGEFIIPEKSSIKDILDIVTSNNTINYKVTIIEGFQKYQIPSIFNGIDNTLGEMPPITQEGVFMPDTYYYKTGDSKKEILVRANKAMGEYLDKAWEGRDKNIPIKTKKEALILASIVEKETSQDDEYKIVASVFMNRLDKGMKLQADSTAIYGITNGKKKFNRKLYKGDLAKINKYNTYVVKKLPIAPICNPGKKAIDAVMHPADTDYLFFVADGTGGHVFTSSGKQHERNVIKWHKIKAK